MMMRQKTGRYIAALFAVLLCVFAVSVPAFAGQSGGEPESSGGAVPGSSSEIESPEGGEQKNVTLNLNGGTGVKTAFQVPKGTPVSEIAKPSRKGYRFVGWTYGGIGVADTFSIDEDIALTAQWEKIAASSAPPRAASSRAAAPSSRVVVDTRESEIERAAERAEQAASDPGTLSSQDWGALLVSSGAASGASSAAPESSPREAQEESSALLPIGVCLIAAGLAGVGAFVYLQFFRGRRGRGPGSGRPRGGGPGDSTAEFTDISSYSDGSHSRDSEELRSLMKAAPGGAEADADWDAFFSGSR